MTIKMTVIEERDKIKELGDDSLNFYDKRIAKIDGRTNTTGEERRKMKRSIFIRTQKRFEKQQGTKSTIRKKRTKKNQRKDYETYDDFKVAVLNTLPPLIKEDVMHEKSFYVFPLQLAYDDFTIPADHFVKVYEKRFGNPPENAILFNQGELDLLALGAVPRTSVFD